MRTLWMIKVAFNYWKVWETKDIQYSINLIQIKIL